MKALKILSIECSASPASVAVIEDGKITASSFVNVKLTHSQTLLPMVESTLKSSMLSINDIDGISVSVGPGSFTGIRIGISIAKGLATPRNLPCVPISTLEAMAYMFLSEDITVCAVMDARCNQLYNALFKVKDGKVVRLCQDRAILIDELKTELQSISDNIVICGDGSDVFYEHIKDFKNIWRSHHLIIFLLKLQESSLREPLRKNFQGGYFRYHYYYKAKMYKLLYLSP